ncbi:MAG: hypothetical protein ABI292_10390 [Rhodoferax sp.]
MLRVVQLLFPNESKRSTAIKTLARVAILASRLTARAPAAAERCPAFSSNLAITLESEVDEVEVAPQNRTTWKRRSRDV